MSESAITVVDDEIVVSSQPLTFEIIDSLNLTEDMISDLCLENYEKDYPEDLVEDDFVKLDLYVQGKKYICIHGFPGNNAAGIIYTENGGEYYNIRKLSKGETPRVVEWYLKKTENGSSFEDAYWYASPRSDENKNESEVETKVSISL